MMAGNGSIYNVKKVQMLHRPMQVGWNFGTKYFETCQRNETNIKPELKLDFEPCESLTVTEIICSCF